jgi:Polyketide cyclase / dehydrase and lipid transport
VQINLMKTVAAQPAAAFALVANVVDWPQIIRSIISIEVLTPGPIRASTRLREHRIMFGRDRVQELEVATIERPHRLRLLVDHTDLNYELDHVIDAVYGGGCRIMLIFRSRPETQAGRAVQPFMTPFMGITLRDELEQDLSDLAAAVTRNGSRSARRG